jgi:hypothetical protein
MSDTASPQRVWRDYNERIQAKDRAGLMAILHPDFVGVDPQGVARGRQEYIDFCCEHLPTELEIRYERIEPVLLAESVLVIRTRQRMGPHPMAPAADGFMTVSIFSAWVDNEGWELSSQQGMVVPDIPS